MQALSLAGGWNVGGNLRQAVIFRRGDDWRLMATLVDIRGALYGKVPTPADELWLNDSDVVVVPKAPIKVFNDYVNLGMTQGLYSVAPFRVRVVQHAVDRGHRVECRAGRRSRPPLIGIVSRIESAFSRRR